MIAINGNNNRPSNLPAPDSELRDYGAQPIVVNIDRLTNRNPFYRLALWTGRHLQVTLMSIRVGGEIGLEVHPRLDQFLHIESGQGLVRMGKSRDGLSYAKRVDSSHAIIVPAGTWHNLFNVGSTPLKLYSIYAPPQHPYSTLQQTKEIADAAER